MRTRLGVIVLLIASCQKGESPAPAPAPAPTQTPTLSRPRDAGMPVDAAAPPHPACIALEATLDSVTITDTGVTFCDDSAAPRACWAVDLATGTYRVTPPTRAPSVPDPADPDRVTSEDGALIAKQGSDGSTVTVTDAASSKVVMTLHGWKTAMEDHATLDLPTFAGDRVIAWAHATPVSDAGRIYSRAGKLIGPIAEPGFTQDPADTWHVAGSEWAFKQLDEPKLITVDLTTGKRVRTFDLTPITAVGSPDEQTDHAEPAGVAIHGDTIVYVTTSGHIGLVDRKTGAVKGLAPPACK